MKKIRKIALGAIILVIMSMLLTACGGTVSMTREEYDNICNTLNQIEEMIAEKDGTGFSVGTSTEESVPEQTQPEKEPKEPPKVILVEQDYELREQSIKVYEEVFAAMESPCSLKVAGNVTCMVFSSNVSKVTVTSNNSQFTIYSELSLSGVSSGTRDIGEGYYIFNFVCVPNTRYIFQITLQGGEQSFFSVQTPQE